MSDVGLTLSVPAELVEEIAQRAAAIALERLRQQAEASPRLLTVPEAAELLRARPQRVYDLLSDGRLTRQTRTARARRPPGARRYLDGRR